MTWQQQKGLGVMAEKVYGEAHTPLRSKREKMNLEEES